MTEHECDVLVIGSGIAGLSFALKAAAHARVAIVTKKESVASSTNYAQGGIAAVMDPKDDPALHLRDTLLAGAGLCRAGAVRLLVREGPARVRELIEWGARFTEEQGRLALGREGGHSRRRIVHAADLTGREIERALLEAVAAHPRIEVFEDHLALDLLIGLDRRSAARRCGGARVLQHTTGRIRHFLAPFTLLATGGLGRAYRHTTNPEIATGDGVAMAYRAGAEVANLEFVQFHPTALYPAEGRAFLISEAVRGEGAVLLRRDGAALMQGVRLGSLATRDIVARAIDLTLKETGEPHALLDLSPIGAHEIERRFPNIVEECRRRGLDPAREPLPVVPAAHYSCGGVRTDAAGRTTLAGLFAAGEVACTGVHGANRLASNSLLEALVYSHRAGEEVRREVDGAGVLWPAAEVLEEPGGRPRANAALLSGLETELRDLMWESAGIVRRDARLTVAEQRLLEMHHEVERELARAMPDEKLIEVRNLVESSLLVVRSALRRQESRGLHFNIDHLQRDNERCLGDTVLVAAGA